jgi:hypothetical protein
MTDGTIFHTGRVFSMCYGGYSRSEALDSGVQPANGMLVNCLVCRRIGVIPDEGHELEFLPPGTERAPGGGFMYRPPQNGG